MLWGERRSKAHCGPQGKAPAGTQVGGGQAGGDRGLPGPGGHAVLWGEPAALARTVRLRRWVCSPDSVLSQYFQVTHLRMRRGKSRLSSRIFSLKDKRLQPRRWGQEAALPSRVPGSRTCLHHGHPTTVPTPSTPSRAGGAPAAPTPHGKAAHDPTQELRCPCRGTGTRTQQPVLSPVTGCSCSAATTSARSAPQRRSTRALLIKGFVRESSLIEHLRWP